MAVPATERFVAADGAPARLEVIDGGRGALRRREPLFDAVARKTHPMTRAFSKRQRGPVQETKSL